MIREKIFGEIIRLKIGVNHVWRFQVYINFCNDTLDPQERDSFFEEMDKLCSEGYFTKEGPAKEPLYRLTELGYNAIY